MLRVRWLESTKIHKSSTDFVMCACPAEHMREYVCWSSSRWLHHTQQRDMAEEPEAATLLSSLERELRMEDMRKIFQNFQFLFRHHYSFANNAGWEVQKKMKEGKFVANYLLLESTFPFNLLCAWLDSSSAPPPPLPHHVLGEKWMSPSRVLVESY